MLLGDLLQHVGRNFSSSNKEKTFQKRVKTWLVACFGENFADDDQERDARFLEEALELFQARGRTFEEVVELAKYVYSRPAGDVEQELGGCMTTLAALSLANNLDMFETGENELSRIWQKVDAIREKQRQKPKNTVLPGAKAPENNWVPTQRQLGSACLSYRHDFGLLSVEEREKVMDQAKWWLIAWLKELPQTPALRNVQAPVEQAESIG